MRHPRANPARGSWLNTVVLVSLAVGPFAWCFAGPAQAWQTDDVGVATAVQQLTELRELVEQLSAAVRKKDDQSAVAALAKVESAIARLAEARLSSGQKRFLAGLERRVRILRQALQRRGVELPKAMQPGETGGDGVSFSRDVAPILVARCSRCHIDRAAANFSMQTFDALARGSRNGPVVEPGSSAGSRLFEVLESGEMPRGGDKLSDEELATVRNWIDAGAKFDGEDRSTPLLDLVPDSSAAGAMRPMLVRPEGNETVSFREHVAPVLVEHCVECHGPTQPSGQLNLDQFAGLLRGGASGSMLEPGQPDESLIIRKLRGMQGQRMPLQRDPLPDDVIARIATWIAEGTAFDGDSPAKSLSRMVAEDQAEAMSHEELAAMRERRSLAKWQLAVPDLEPKKAESANFLVLGNASEDVLGRIAETAEQELSRLRPWLGVNGQSLVFKGRLTLYVFGQRFDYIEFGKMVEQHEIPVDWSAHWDVGVLDAYACLFVSEDEAANVEEELAGELAELIAGARLRQLGAASWFAQGMGAALRGKLIRGDERTIERRQQLGSLGHVDQSVLVSGFAMDELALVRFGLCEFLLSSPPRYRQLIKALNDGEMFEDALREAYGRDGEQLVALWQSRSR